MSNDFSIKPIKLNSISIYGSNSNKRDKQPAHLKTQTRQRWWGNSLFGECFCCGRSPLHYDDAEVGHIQAASKGGKWAPDNCRLLCRKCNSGMRATNMKVYMKRTYPERYEKFYPNEEKKTVDAKPKPIRKKSTGQKYYNPLTGKYEKNRLF